jgi:tetratricopeptide (TPR) repeat protein
MNPLYFPTTATGVSIKLDGDDILKVALAHHHAGELDAALHQYQTLLQRDADNADAHYGVGTVMLRKGKLEQAAEHLGRAVEQAPDVPEFIFNFALVMEQLGQMKEAAAAFQRAGYLVSV